MFLKPLTPVRAAERQEGPFINHHGDVDQPLVYKFSEKLAKQHDQKAAQKKWAEEEARAALMDPSWLCIESEALKFEELKRRWKLYETVSNMESDREISGSRWTIAKLERYIGPKDIAFVQLLESPFDLSSHIMKEICERVVLATKAVSGRDGSVKSLRQTESNTRMVLDAILQRLCVHKGLTLRCEQTITSDDFPANRYDYIIYHKTIHNCPIGVVEAKRKGSLKDDSVAQLLVQLLLLSSEEPNFFYFGVLSDSYQFIFAGVSEQKVCFFQTNENQLEITTINSEPDVVSIIGKISWLIELAHQSRKSNDPAIEAFLVPGVAAMKIHESLF